MSFITLLILFICTVSIGVGAIEQWVQGDDI